MSSRTLCSALVQVAGDETGALVIWKKSQKMVLRSNRCKNRNDIAGQPIGIEWRVFLDTSVHVLQKIKFSCWKLDTTLIVCQTGPCSRACSTKLGKPKSTNKCPAPAEEVANMLQHSDLVIDIFVIRKHPFSSTLNWNFHPQVEPGTSDCVRPPRAAGVCSG